MIPRANHPDPDRNSPPPREHRPAPKGVGRGGDNTPNRLNLLLSAARWRSDTTFDQIPPLLEPLGVQTIRTHSGEEAADVIRSVIIHIAVVDLSVPLQRPEPASPPNRLFAEAGPRILQLLRRLDAPPPTVVVRPPQPAARESARSLAQALREGAFAVLDQPVHLEAMLEVLRRILRRHYSDIWPA